LAEQQQERAVRNAEGHIIGGSDSDDDGENKAQTLTLEEDLAKMENTDGCWDECWDDDIEMPTMLKSISKATLTSASSSNELNSANDSVIDVWDL
jgi:hypothetical protein